MDVKDLRTEAALRERNNDGSKYTQGGVVALQGNRNKSYQDIVSNPLAKTEGAPSVRPCAVIGPDRVLPPPASNDTFIKKGSVEPWPNPDSVYRRPPDYPHRHSTLNPTRNISPRQTFQENMQRINVPPTYNAARHSDSSNFNHIQDRNDIIAKNVKQNVVTEAKYCDVPYALNIANEPKNIREPELYMPTVNPPLTRPVPNVWPPSSVNVNASRTYSANEPYQYPQYPSCAGQTQRPSVIPMTRPHRIIQEDPAYAYPDHYYPDASSRFKPFPHVKERYPQPRYEYVGNYPGQFHPPPPVQSIKYDIPKSGQSYPYSIYPHLKYLENRAPDPTIESYQRQASLQPHYNLQFRNQVIHPSYGQMNGSIPQKLHPYPSDGSIKASTKLHYDNNTKMYIDYESTKSKPYPMPENYLANEMNRFHSAKNQMLMPNYSPIGMRGMPSQQFYLKDNPQMKPFEYMPHLRSYEPQIVGNPMLRHAPQFSPNTLAISPTDSCTSNDTLQTHETSQEDCGYVSQSSTASVRSLESSIFRLPHEYYKRQDYKYNPIVGSAPTLTKTDITSKGHKQKQIDVRQFLSMWNEGEEENSENNNFKEVIIQTGSSETSNLSKQHANNQDQLYVLGLVNVPSEELSKYEHIEKISKLPENIKGYNNLELYSRFEEAMESCTTAAFKVGTKEYQISSKDNPKKVEPLPRPVSPLDVEAKISQSVIHKEVGCNFEIRPCTPKMLNVELAAPAQKVLGERIIEKVSNPLSKITKSPLLNKSDENSNCHTNKKSDNNFSISDNPSCKMTCSPYSSNNMDSVKTNYSMQDLEINSGVCLASLPQLDNEIELNFPEVNQQFINANKKENLSTASNSHQNNSQDSSLPDGKPIDAEKSELISSNAEKTTNKLSKYRKIKTNDISNNKEKVIRTDSVIIKNPENVKNIEDKLLENSLNIPMDLSSPVSLASQSSQWYNSPPEPNENKDNDMALDFSLNKSSNDLPIIEMEKDIPTKPYEITLSNLTSESDSAQEPECSKSSFVDNSEIKSSKNITECLKTDSCDPSCAEVSLEVEINDVTKTSRNCEVNKSIIMDNSTVLSISNIDRSDYLKSKNKNDDAKTHDGNTKNNTYDKNEYLQKEKRTDIPFKESQSIDKIKSIDFTTAEVTPMLNDSIPVLSISNIDRSDGLVSNNKEDEIKTNYTNTQDMTYDKNEFLQKETCTDISFKKSQSVDEHFTTDEVTPLLNDNIAVMSISNTDSSDGLVSKNKEDEMKTTDTNTQNITCDNNEHLSKETCTDIPFESQSVAEHFTTDEDTPMLNDNVAVLSISNIERSDGLVSKNKEDELKTNDTNTQDITCDNNVYLSKEICTDFPFESQSLDKHHTTDEVTSMLTDNVSDKDILERDVKDCERLAKQTSTERDEYSENVKQIFNPDSDASSNNEQMISSQIYSEFEHDEISANLEKLFREGDEEISLPMVDTSSVRTHQLTPNSPYFLKSSSCHLSKELHSPWIQKLLTYNEGSCLLEKKVTRLIPDYGKHDNENVQPQETDISLEEMTDQQENVTIYENKDLSSNYSKAKYITENPVTNSSQSQLDELNPLSDTIYEMNESFDKTINQTQEETATLAGPYDIIKEDKKVCTAKTLNKTIVHCDSKYVGDVKKTEMKSNKLLKSHKLIIKLSDSRIVVDNESKLKTIYNNVNINKKDAKKNYKIKKLKKYRKTLETKAISDPLAQPDFEFDDVVKCNSKLPFPEYIPDVTPLSEHNIELSTHEICKELTKKDKNAGEASKTGEFCKKISVENKEEQINLSSENISKYDAETTHETNQVAEIIPSNIESSITALRDCVETINTNDEICMDKLGNRYSEYSAEHKTNPNDKPEKFNEDKIIQKSIKDDSMSVTIETLRKEREILLVPNSSSETSFINRSILCRNQSEDRLNENQDKEKESETFDCNKTQELQIPCSSKNGRFLNFYNEQPFEEKEDEEKITKTKESNDLGTDVMLKALNNYEVAVKNRNTILQNTKIGSTSISDDFAKRQIQKCQIELRANETCSNDNKNCAQDISLTCKYLNNCTIEDHTDKQSSTENGDEVLYVQTNCEKDTTTDTNEIYTKDQMNNIFKNIGKHDEDKTKRNLSPSNDEIIDIKNDNVDNTNKDNLSDCFFENSFNDVFANYTQPTNSHSQDSEGRIEENVVVFDKNEVEKQNNSEPCNEDPKCESENGLKILAGSVPDKWIEYYEPTHSPSNNILSSADEDFTLCVSSEENLCYPVVENSLGDIENETCNIPVTPIPEPPLKHRFSLKRSFSDSALNRYKIKDTSESQILDNTPMWPPKRQKVYEFEHSEQQVIGESLCNFIQNNRRNSVSSYYNEENVSFCILIDNDCIITDENEGDKICFAELSEDCITELNTADVENNVADVEDNANVICCSEENELDFSESVMLDYDGEKSIQESWLDDVACVETVVSDELVEQTYSKALASPRNTRFTDGDESETFNSDMIELAHGVDVVEEEIISDDVSHYEMTYKLPPNDHTTVLDDNEYRNKSDILYCSTLLENTSVSHSGGCSPSPPTDHTESMVLPDITTNSELPENKENIFESNLQNSDDNLNHSTIRAETESIYAENITGTSCSLKHDDAANLPESSINNVFSCEKGEDDASFKPSSSSPEVSSTTFEDKTSSILLKITNYNGSRVSEINEVNRNRPRCKFTESKDYSNSQGIFPKRPLMTKAAQKYIPPLKESISDLKVKLPLPQQRLLKLKQLKQSKSEPKVVNKYNISTIPKKVKPKPNFEDVLKNIDEVQIKMHKEKNKKVKNMIPKVVIKKNVNGSHYTSSSSKQAFNPDLTGRKWQPWVFLEKNLFIDNMAIKNKTKAIFSHRLKTYVLAEKFKRYKSINSCGTKFVITQPKTGDSSKGQLKYTIRVKHAY